MQVKVRIDKKYRARLLERWSAEKLMLGARRTPCPICADAKERAKVAGDPGDVCRYCPVDWRGEPGRTATCVTFLEWTIGERATALALGASVKLGEPCPMTAHQYSEAYAALMEAIEWIDDA